MSALRTCFVFSHKRMVLNATWTRTGYQEVHGDDRLYICVQNRPNATHSHASTVYQIHNILAIYIGQPDTSWINGVNKEGKDLGSLLVRQCGTTLQDAAETKKIISVLLQIKVGIKYLFPMIKRGTKMDGQ